MDCVAYKSHTSSKKQKTQSCVYRKRIVKSLPTLDSPLPVLQIYQQFTLKRQLTGKVWIYKCFQDICQQWELLCFSAMPDMFTFCITTDSMSGEWRNICISLLIFKHQFRLAGPSTAQQFLSNPDTVIADASQWFFNQCLLHHHYDYDVQTDVSPLSTGTNRWQMDLSHPVLLSKTAIWQ